MRSVSRRLGTALRVVAIAVTELAPDVAIVGGAGLISYGVWLLNKPAAFIVGGTFLLVGGWLFARRSAAE